MIEAGVDESGRGSLVGPVVAAAVILDPAKPIPGLKDSKKLSKNNLKILRQEILEKSLDYSLASCSSLEVDSTNILSASLKAMSLALSSLRIVPDIAYIDGTFIPDSDIHCTAIIKGDNIFKNIMAASILAKTERDRMMLVLDKKYPEYNFKNNKGYPTKEHLKNIKAYGSIKEHRKSFKPLKDLIR